MKTVELDCRGLSCPMPIVKISRAMKELAVGDQLSVEASDPSFEADLEAWVRKLGQKLVAFSEDAGTQKALLLKQV